MISVTLVIPVFRQILTVGTSVMHNVVGKLDVL